MELENPEDLNLEDLISDEKGNASTTFENQFFLQNENIRLLRSQIRYGAGNPEGVITANMGTMYQNSLGGAGTTLYVKESGTGNTGWIGK